MIHRSTYLFVEILPRLGHQHVELVTFKQVRTEIKKDLKHHQEPAIMEEAVIQEEWLYQPQLK